jgi:preprotein translocase subunit SecG
MEILLISVYVIVSLFLIIVVLLQSGKAADLAGAFGGMGSQTAFGPRGSATLLSKATTLAAVLFMLLSITLGIVKSRDRGVGESVIERTGTAGEPATPGTQALEPGTRTIPLDIPPPPQSGSEPAAGTEGGDTAVPQ